MIYIYFSLLGQIQNDNNSIIKKENGINAIPIDTNILSSSKNWASALKNILPFHSIEMGFNPLLKENDINAIPIDTNILSSSKMGFSP